MLVRDLESIRSVCFTYPFEDTIKVFQVLVRSSVKTD